VRQVRSWAIAALVLLGAFHVMRLAAAACSGAACDAFIPLSLLLPAAVLVCAGVAGTIAASGAGGAPRALLVAATLLSTAGPLIALALFRDSPDSLVAAATMLFLFSPAAALAYSFRPASPRRAR